MTDNSGEFTKSKIAGEREEAKPAANGLAQAPPKRARRRVVFTPAWMPITPPTEPRDAS